ncbi:aldehyde dehydrogenase family protein [Rhizobium sp. KAs_5_22]|nr:aldehyde dehydrogenase family protein [Rhizobium sp. KAs_5_22]
MQIMTEHFIGGRFVESHGKEVMEIHNPATGELIGLATLGDEVDTERAIAAAKAAFVTWSKTTLEERKVWLQRLADAITERMDDLKAITIAEYGAPAVFTDYIVDQARDFFIFAQDLLKPENFEIRQGLSTIQKLPIGVAGLMTPWNGSPWFVCEKAASALAAGCTVVMKPSELSPLQSKVLMECFKQAGLPAGVINLVNGRGDIVGNTITRSPNVEKISFTGSTRVGKMIASQASERMKRVTLELGGKSPTIILDDAEMGKAVEFALMVGLMNTGQSCTAGTRILVPKSRLDEIKQYLKTGIENLQIGDPSKRDTVIQPMVSAAHYERVQGYIRKGISEGAEVLIGGEGKPVGFENGNYVKPTVFVGVTNDMVIAREEIFGPVLCVITYDGDDEAVRIANDTDYGLYAYVFGADAERAQGIANHLLSGCVSVNEFIIDPAAPFGGFKLSGIGREFGIAGLESYLETRVILSR